VLALLVVSLTGRKAISRYSWAVDTHSLFRRLIGVIFILIGIAIITGQEIKIETWVGNHLPFDETRIERVLLQKQHKSTLVHSIALRGNVLNVQATQAPQFVGLTNWINSKPTTLDQLKGQVVLVDFWTYSCINCIRSLPYVEKWYQTYHDKGFTVIGVSTPEFAFEHNPANVAAAVKRDGLTYPVALDNNYDTWNAYDNDSWPADYLIDKNGDIRYVSLGEGNYNVTEEAIQTLLGINQPLKTPKSVVPISQNQTSETYFGTNREQNYTGLPNLVDGLSNYSEASSLGSNQWSLGGSWQINSQSITSESASSVLTFNVTARNVYMVAGDQNNNTQNVEVTLPPHVTNLVDSSGAAAVNGSISVPVSGSNIYNIARLSKFGTTTVTLTVPAGVSLYTFTFGS
jgi:thiol-disulfide isomerase/thioredoxin